MSFLPGVPNLSWSGEIPNIIMNYSVNYSAKMYEFHHRGLIKKKKKGQSMKTKGSF